MSESSCLCEQIAGPGAELHPKCFGHVWLFEGAPPEAWDTISADLARKKCAAEDVIFSQGEPAESMYLIKMGSVKIWKVDEEGRELTLDIRKAGDLLGESVLIEESDYPVYASALTPTLICGVDRSTFEKLVEAHPQVGLAVIRNLSKRIDYLTGKLGALSEPSIEERLYKVLVNVAEQVGTPESGGWSIAFPLTHEEIGFLVGAHRVSITRALKKLKDLGKVKSQGKYIFVARAAA
ncbi:Crp/Fnr family transcriptional regulator [Trichlorobacter lovleyi]|nr:Crp/Fnr family transcriptional regulator [Trichlorobacter lovleyi]